MDMSKDSPAMRAAIWQKIAENHHRAATTYASFHQAMVNFDGFKVRAALEQQMAAVAYSNARKEMGV